MYGKLNGAQDNIYQSIRDELCVYSMKWYCIGRSGENILNVEEARLLEQVWTYEPLARRFLRIPSEDGWRNECGTGILPKPCNEDVSEACHRVVACHLFCSTSTWMMLRKSEVCKYFTAVHGVCNKGQLCSKAELFWVNKRKERKQ